MIQKLVTRIKIAEAKKELLNFTVTTLKDDGVISDESFNKWRNIKSGSVFDGVNSIFGCWRYGLKWEYVQIEVNRDIIKITKAR